MFKKAQKLDDSKKVKFEYYLDYRTLKANKCELDSAIAGWDEITLIKEGHDGNLDTMLAKCGNFEAIYFGKWNDGIF